MASVLDTSCHDSSVSVSGGWTHGFFLTLRDKTPCQPQPWSDVTFLRHDILTRWQRKPRCNEINDRWIPFSCFRFRVLMLDMLTHGHTLTGLLKYNRAIISIISNTCSFATVWKCLSVLRWGQISINNLSENSCEVLHYDVHTARNIAPHPTVPVSQMVTKLPLKCHLNAWVGFGSSN